MGATRSTIAGRFAPGIGLGLGLAVACCGGANQNTAVVSQERPHPPAETPARGGGPLPAAVATPPSSVEARQALEKAYRAYRGLNDGKNADYIPVLAKVDPSLFGIALAAPNGEVVEIGDSRHAFSIQSVAKVFTLGRVLEDVGAEKVEKTIGLDATGQSFNSILAIALNEKHRAGNPLVNAGAIAAVGLVSTKTPAERWNHLNENLNAFAGRTLSIDPEVFRSETETNQGNRGIAWMLKNYGVIAGDPEQVLDVYTRECSIALTARDLAIMGATLANGGLNPTNGRRVITADNAARVLAQMMTNGLYETTGTWAFNAGLPAKSGVGGGIVAVVPGRFAIATFSPRLDEAGNSVRGQRAIESIVKDLDANIFKARPAKPSLASVPPAGAPPVAAGSR
jgi:glutaminase